VNSAKPITAVIVSMLTLFVTGPLCAQPTVPDAQAESDFVFTSEPRGQLCCLAMELSDRMHSFFKASASNPIQDAYTQRSALYDRNRLPVGTATSRALPPGPSGLFLVTSGIFCAIAVRQHKTWARAPLAFAAMAHGRIAARLPLAAPGPSNQRSGLPTESEGLYNIDCHYPTRATHRVDIEYIGLLRHLASIPEAEATPQPTQTAPDDNATDRPSMASCAPQQCVNYMHSCRRLRSLSAFCARLVSDNTAKLGHSAIAVFQHTAPAQSTPLLLARGPPPAEGEGCLTCEEEGRCAQGPSKRGDLPCVFFQDYSS